MIITDRFVYLHFPKTGGTFVRTVLERICRPVSSIYLDEKNLKKHGGVADIPDKYRDLPILCAIRNPFSHIVSFYEFEWWKSHPEDTFNVHKMKRKYPHYPEINFSEYIVSLYDLNFINQNNINKHVLKKLKQNKIGLLTLDYIKFFAKNSDEILNEIEYLNCDKFKKIVKNINIMKMFKLRIDLYSNLRILGFSGSQLELLENMERIFPQGGRDYQSRHWIEYYTLQTLDMVRTRERMVFSLFPEFDV